jgi:F-type H+-transporting ATPase subunit b
MSTQPPPAERANDLMEKLPSKPSLITKTGTALLGTGVLATAISQELYVLNEESVLLAGTFILLTYIGSIIRKPYSEWAEGHIQRISGILNQSRTEHTQAVKDRITSVEQMKDVVDVTKGLFALSKETATLEAETFTQQQKVALTSELKAVLDSWVRFEQSVRESEQADLTKSVIDKVLASVQDEKTQKDILLGAVAEVEQLVKSKAI